MTIEDFVASLLVPASIILLGGCAMNPDSFHAENPQTAVESGDAWQRLVDAIRSEVSAVFAAHGLEFRGELRGVLQEPGRPETANGLGLEFGGGLPPGWKKT